MAGFFGDPRIDDLATRLHDATAAEEAGIGQWFGARARAGELSWDGFDAKSHAFMADKLVALERDKAQFCHLTCRALRARRVVEVGTSHGASTLYLATAVRDNGGGVVIGTEHEAGKAAIARETFAAAGLAEFVELREGDLRETLKTLAGPIDFVLVDIWVEMARPALELIAPHLRPGAVVIADNVISAARSYGPYMDFVSDPANGFRTMTLPFNGGLEFSVKTGGEDA